MKINIKKALKYLDESYYAGYFEEIDKINIPEKFKDLYSNLKKDFLDGGAGWELVEKLRVFVRQINRVTETLTRHNLPNRPYDEFFGRTKQLEEIRETLIEGRTYIASIDGIGGIGKTALTYNFCETVLLPENLFDYLVWVTAKDTVFDTDKNIIRNIDNDFKNNSVETLINETISVVECQDILLESYDYRLSFFEDIVRSEKIFFVIDNLETLEDKKFFDFIKRFNKLGKNNDYLKILTTSRKKAKIADHPIKIEGLQIPDALTMLNHLVRNNLRSQVHFIDSSNDKKKKEILQKIGCMPLGIEFIVKQMAKGKSLGQVYQELEGYPSLEGIENKSEVEKKRVMSDILLFSFKNMYETLDEQHHLVFKIIAALERNIQESEKTYFGLILRMSKLSPDRLEEILINLIENKLIIDLGNDEYSISQMSINFVRRYFDNFGEVEDEFVGMRDAIEKNKKQDEVDIFISSLSPLTKELKYQEAEKLLLNALSRKEDYRLYYELAKVQANQKRIHYASDNFKRATELSPTSKNVWYDWINMESTQKRKNIPLKIAKSAIEKTDYEISLVKQTFDVYKFQEKYNELRVFAKKMLDSYNNNDRKDDWIKLLRHWKSAEYIFLKRKINSEYFSLVEQLISEETDREKKLNLLYEELNIAKKLFKGKKFLQNISIKIEQQKRAIENSINKYVKDMNFYNSGFKRDPEKSKKLAKFILQHSEDTKDIHLNQRMNALTVLLQSYSREGEFDKIISYYEMYQKVAVHSQNCIEIYNKAVKEKEQIEKDNLINNILFKLSESENRIRKFVMSCFNNNENVFLEFLKVRLVENNWDWIASWEVLRNRSVNKNRLIYYSDLEHLIYILTWLIHDLSKYLKVKNISEIENKINLLKLEIKHYETNKNNETFDYRLTFLEKESLNKIHLDIAKIPIILEDIEGLLN